MQIYFYEIYSYKITTIKKRYFCYAKRIIEKAGIAENKLFKNHFILTQLHPEEETYFFDRIYIMLTKVYYEYDKPNYLCISTQITIEPSK